MTNIIISVDIDRVSLKDATKLTALIKEIVQIPTVTVVTIVDNSGVTLAVRQGVAHLAKLAETLDGDMTGIERSEDELVDALKQLSDPAQEALRKPATAAIRDKHQQDRYRQKHHSKHHKK